MTISGPPEAVAKFVKELQVENIFAKEVASAGVAFHSKYIQDAAPKLRKRLEEVTNLLLYCEKECASFVVILPNKCSF